MAFPTNANQVQAFAGAMYGVQIGSVTMAQVTSDIAAVGGLNNALNSYYAYSFGSVATATVAATVAANLGLTGSALTAGTAYITAQLNAAAPGARGAVIANTLSLFAGLASDATFGVAATAWNAKVDTAAAYTGATNVAIGSVVSETVFTLTTDVDSITATAGNDTFRGTFNDDNTDNLSTIQTGDIIDGGAGTDKLEITVVANQGTTPLLETVSVEAVYIRQLDDGANTIDASLWAGVQQVWMNKSLENLNVDEIQNEVTLGVKDTKDLSLKVTYTADALGSAEATQKFVFQNAGDAANGNTLELEVFLNGSDQVTAVEIAATGANSVDLYGEIDGFMESVKVTGSGSLYLEDGGGAFDEATTVDLSANSGGVTIEVANEDVVVTGGSGDDAITLSNSDPLTDLAGIVLGAGNDSLLDNGSAGVGTDAVLDGGHGDDTIGSTLLEVGNSANIKNFEVLDLAGESRAIDASLFSASTFKSLALTDNTVGAISVSKLAGTQIVLNNTSAANVGTTITATLATATGTADSAQINFNGDGSSTLSNFTTAGLETITIDSQSENAGDANAITVITTTDNVLTTVTITGDKDFTLGGVTVNTAATPTTVTTAATTTSAALTSINGSAATGDLTITAGALVTTNNLTMIFNTLNIQTGEGDDTVSIGGRGTVETGTGADNVNVAVLGVSVNVGVDEDVDSVVLAATADFNTAVSGTTRVTTISNLAADDTISFASIENAAATVNDYTTTALTFASFDTAANAAIADVASAVDFFNWVDGNTYIVVNGADDTIIKLVGAYDTFTLAAGVVTIG